jgi:anti-anti-sigma regulatory factor
MGISEAASRIPNSGSPGEGVLILLAGALDLESTDRLEREFAEATWIGTGQVTLDMSGLQLIDAAAVSSVLRGIAKLRAAGVALDIRYPSPMALQLFEMCTSLQILGIEFSADPQAHLNDGTIARVARGISDVQAGFGPL